MGFRGNGGVKIRETRSYQKVYLTQKKLIRHCFLAFYTTIALKSNMPPTFSKRMFHEFLFTHRIFKLKVINNNN